MKQITWNAPAPLKHTPLPWDFHIADNAEVPHFAIYTPDAEGCEDERIADVYSEADGFLMLAAPELLAGLKAILECCELNLDELEPETIETIEAGFAAIRKAEGRTV